MASSPSSPLPPTDTSFNSAEPDSDTEEDPGQLLNMWLGELNTLKRGLDTPTKKGGAQMNGGAFAPPVVKRQQQQQQKMVSKEEKNQYRCSLIKLEETQDDELDAILGELSVLESQFDEEIAGVDRQLNGFAGSTKEKTVKFNCAPDAPPSPSEGSDGSSRSSGRHSRSSSESAEVTGRGQVVPTNGAVAAQPSQNGNGKRTDSPDNDSAFCDNVSVLSSCSASSSSRTDQSKSSSSGVSSTTSPTTNEAQDQEARIKAEKIKLAIEKIKEASVKKLFIKVFTTDGSAKSLLIDEKMTVGHVTRILAEKNLVKLDPKWALVELVPDLYMERAYEDHENLVENCLMWKVDSKNTLWFIERPEKYDLFVRPEKYLLGSSSSQKGEHLEDHSRQELLEEYFSSSGVGAPEVEGFIWLKAESKKSWKKFFFVLRSSGLYYAPKGKKTSKDLICLATFDVNQIYYGAGWKRKYKAPTNYCFAIKHPQIQAKSPKYIRYLCVDTEKELHQWVTGIRIAKNGKQIYDNYRSVEEEITHADIDILTSKRLSVNSPNTLQISAATHTNGDTSSPARTPSSENKSLDSALSSGIASDMSSSASNSAHSLGASQSETGSSETSSQQLTPVNTIQRSGEIRRSISRASKASSSSSGCLSDRSSLQGTISEQGGFESDFPAGGTIKKRPSVNARIPLTTTTWGLVRDSDEDSNDASGPNVRVGGGGTLLRSAVRHSMRKNGSGGDLHSSRGSLESSDGGRQQQVLAEVHVDVDPMSAQFESSVCQPGGIMQTSIDEQLPLPPPPRDESLDRLSAMADDLPPPPPEVYDESTSHYHVSPVKTAHRPPSGSLPVSAPLPPSLKKPTNSPSKPVPNGTRKISFDENVQMFDDTSFPRACPMPLPNRLYAVETQSQAAPPKEFLNDLQRVMNKKWQIAEKCRSDLNTTPHQVLGFRDEISHLVGYGNNYSRNDANDIGQWVLQSQQFSPIPPPQASKPSIAEPLYAVSTKRIFNGHGPAASHYAPGMVHPKPVILREPTPEYDPYAVANTCHMANDNGNYSTISYGNPNRGSFRNQGSPAGSGRGSPAHKPPAPPPPRRSEHTQLTTATGLRS